MLVEKRFVKYYFIDSLLWFFCVFGGYMILNYVLDSLRINFIWKVNDG